MPSGVRGHPPPPATPPAVRQFRHAMAIAHGQTEGKTGIKNFLAFNSVCHDYEGWRHVWRKGDHFSETDCRFRKR